MSHHKTKSSKNTMIMVITLLISFCLSSIGYSQQNDLNRVIKDLKDKNPSVRWLAAGKLGDMNDARAVGPLIDALKDSYIYSEVIKALGKIGSPAVEPLIVALKDKNRAVRQGAVDALGETKDARAVGPLIDALKDFNVKRKAAKALGKIGAPAVEPLIATIKDKDKADIHMAARQALIEIRDGRAVKPLIDALKDLYVQEVAAIALGQIGTPAVEPLIAALKDKDSYVRRLAAEALGVTKDARAVGPLINALKDFDVQDAAAIALGQIGTPAVEPLIATLKNKDANVRHRSAKALGKIGAPAVEPLIATIKDKDANVRHGVVEALGLIKDARAVGPLIATLKDQDTLVRQGTAKALGLIKDVRAVGPLITTLKDQDLNVRWRSANALGQIGTPAVEPLIAAREDEASDVRWWVAVALGEIVSYQKDARAYKALTATLAGKDILTIAENYLDFIHKGEVGTEVFLIMALQQNGSKKMAEDFLSCGNSLLKKVGSEWATKNGYFFVPTIRYGAPMWGRKK